MEINKKREEIEKAIITKFENAGFIVTQTWWNSDPLTGSLYGFGCGLKNKYGAEFIFEQGSGLIQTK